MVQDSLRPPSATVFSVDDLVREVLAGRMRIPSFQRSLKWQWEDARRLFDSIVRGYPIGSLLLWERPADAARFRLGGLEIEADAMQTALWVVDGQQRITTLASALSDSNDSRFALAYDLQEKKFVRPDPRAELLVPLPTLFDLRRLLKWFADHPEATDHLEAASGVTKTIREYAVPTYVVRHSDETVLRDIFDRMNNYGKRLTQAEVFSALHEGTSRSGSDRPLSGIAEAIDGRYGFGSIDDDTVLRALLARRGPDVTRDIRVEFERDRVHREFPTESANDAYHNAEIALGRAVEFLQKEAFVPHFAFLPYRYLLVVLTRFFAHHPKPKPRNRALLRRWFWRAALIGPSLGRGSYNEAMRTLARRIDPGDESGSVQALLASLESRPLAFEFPRRFKSTTAEVRFVLCALWSLGPRSFRTGEPYDAGDLSVALAGERTASSALALLLPKAPEARTRIGNRVFALDGDTDDDLRNALEATPSGMSAKKWAKVLESHAIDAEMRACLERGESTELFDARERNVGAITSAFLARMTESALEDTPPLDELDLDEPDEEVETEAGLDAGA